MTRDLIGCCALITGASSGIGEATAKELAAKGMRVALVADKEKELNRVTGAIVSAGGSAISMVVDLSKPAEVEGLVEKVEALIGPLDLLVNNAGVGLGAAVVETEARDLRFLFEVNFFSLAEICRQAMRSMGARRSGHIINVSSAAARFGGPGISAYSATKGAVHAFTQALRIEATAAGVSVSEVLPVSVGTRFFDNVRGEGYRPKGIVLTAERVAQSITRCAMSHRPRPEVLPYPGLRALFVVNALLPGLLVRLVGSRYAADSR
ncbi:MAG TPA: SDR family oxidoreductase [Chthonomonadales bacterium]|nr:SDR family oxidoreductase [Chthonomonadales bacterium]